MNRRLLPFAIAALGCAIFGARNSSAESKAPAGVPSELVAALRKHCVDCHGKDKPEAGFDLVSFKDSAAILREHKRWEQAIERVNAGTMPPEGSDPMPLAERDRLIAAIRQVLKRDCGGPLDPGPTPLRRLNRTEYGNTVRDLMGVHFSAAEKLPADGGGGAGFDNHAETLFISPILMEKYFETAEEVVEYVFRDEKLKKRIFFTQPSDKQTEVQTARRIVEQYARRGFRRVPAKEDVDRLMAIYEGVRSRQGTYEDGVRLAIKGILVSPLFLFREEQLKSTAEAHKVSDPELAVRLAYFLWSSMPDDELFKLATQNKLSDPKILDQQIARMIKSPKSRALADNFAGQWLRYREVGRQVKPSTERFKSFNEDLAFAMREEVALLFDSIIREDRPIVELIDADYTFLNTRLASHYGIKGQEKLGAMLKKVQLPDRTRGGVLTSAAILTLTSYPLRTSPVLRGAWVLQEIVGAPAPPPPPDAGVLPEDDRIPDGLTLRQRLEKHRTKSECAACHARMDPIGFGLENFDAIGRWREKDGKQSVDSIGVLPSGDKFNGPAELKKVLLQRKDEIVGNIAERMLGYATGRTIRAEDGCVVDDLVEAMKKKEYRSHALVYGIIHSVPFQYRRGTAWKETTP